MKRLRTLGSAAILCGGILALSGCHHQDTGANGVPSAASQAPQSAQTQIQQIENDPHIPAAKKAGIEAEIDNNNKNMTSPPPAHP